jgi:pullulanase/glycogen debranching enzyme
VPDADGVTDVAWHDADGRTLDPAAWQSPDRALAVLIGRPGRGAPPTARTLLLLVNGDAAPRTFRLPPGRWHALLDSGEPEGEPREAACADGRVVGGDRIILLEAAP